jgi:hypothetical protein
MAQRTLGRPGNRRPIGILPRAVPTNRIPNAQARPERVQQSIAKAQVSEASDAAVVTTVAASIPPDFTDQVSDLLQRVEVLENQ